MDKNPVPVNPAILLPNPSRVGGGCPVGVVDCCFWVVAGCLFGRL